MSKSIQLKNKNNEKFYPHPYYPVGSIYLSVNNTNPSRWFGGTWVQIAKGRTLVGVDTNDTDFNTVQKTGGEKVHQLTENEMPSHSHYQGSPFGYITTWNHIDNKYSVSNNSRAYTDRALGCTSAINDAFSTQPTGGNQAHNNLQPYFTCYIWCRTA